MYLKFDIFSSCASKFRSLLGSQRNIDSSIFLSKNFRDHAEFLATFWKPRYKYVQPNRNPRKVHNFRRVAPSFLYRISPTGGDFVPRVAVVLIPFLFIDFKTNQKRERRGTLEGSVGLVALFIQVFSSSCLLSFALSLFARVDLYCKVFLSILLPCLFNLLSKKTGKQQNLPSRKGARSCLTTMS